MNIQNILNLANRSLKNSTINFSESDSEILLSKVLKENKKYLILNLNKKIKKMILIILII